MSSKVSIQDSRQQIRVAIIGAGISGLALANGLLKDESQRFQVSVYERDQIAYELDRGGYQLRMAAGGIEALKACLDLDTWNELQRAWAGDDAKAPSMVDPKSMTVHLNLAEVKVYPKSRPIARTDLKRVLLTKPAQHNIVKWGHSFDRYELKPASDGSDNHQVLIHFQDPEAHPAVYADIIVAADGSNSRINRQAGLNNKIKLKSWTLIQSRGPIDKSIFDKLPRSLLTQGSNLYLAGTSYSGYAAVYQDSLLETKMTMAEEEREFQLFWSALVPKDIGDSIIEKSGNDKRRMVKLLCEYLVNTLQYEDDGLPFIFENALDHVRTGAVTSSYQPTSDWRQGKSANARIIIMGDAMHPMTPGRGMGANQALMDAGNLSNLLRNADFSLSSSGVLDSGASDYDLQRLVKTFDAEMYERAFKMVKASEDMSGLDLTTSGGKVKIAIGKFVLTTIGYVVTILEALGLKQPQEISFVHPDEKRAA